jgi:hypothetical protein
MTKKEEEEEEQKKKKKKKKKRGNFSAHVSTMPAMGTIPRARLRANPC